MPSHVTFFSDYNYDFLIFLGLKSKCYYKKHFNVTDSHDVKHTYKHKGIKSIRQLSFDTFYNALTKNEVSYVTEKHFKIEKFQIFASEMVKKCGNAADLKRYYFSEYFSLPFGHKDIDLFEDKIDKNENVDIFKESHAPHYIPPYFFDKMVKNVYERKCFNPEGELFEDFDASSSNNEVLYNLLESDLSRHASDKSMSSPIRHYVGEKVLRKQLTSAEVDLLYEESKTKDNDVVERYNTNTVIEPIFDKRLDSNGCA